MPGATTKAKAKPAAKAAVPPPAIPAKPASTFDSVLPWVGQIVGMLSKEPPDHEISNLVAIAVRMSEFDRKELARIITTYAG